MVCMGRLDSSVGKSIIFHPLRFWHLNSNGQACSACAFLYRIILPALLLLFSVGWRVSTILFSWLQKLEKLLLIPVTYCYCWYFKMNVYIIWDFANFNCTVNLGRKYPILLCLVSMYRNEQLQWSRNIKI